jgi:Protein of unknwon function (DUF3310)
MGHRTNRERSQRAKLNKGKPYEQTPAPFKIRTEDVITRGAVDQVASQAVGVLRPAHYGGKDDPFEAIKVIEAWGLGFNLGNAVKYISRAGKKDPAKLVEDLMKARTYIDFEIERQARVTK